MKKAIDESSNLMNVDIDHGDMLTMIEESESKIKQLSSDDAKRIFWEQQVRICTYAWKLLRKLTLNYFHSMCTQKKAATVKGKGMRWHPLMLRLCLHLKYHSTTAYEILRNVIYLPSTRTLRDYTSYIKTKPGKYL